MKDMSYRDKMVILIISVIIIMIAGFFALIKPAYQKLVSDTATYESTKTEWEGIKAKIDAIPPLKESITSAYNDAKKDAAVFKNTAFGDVDNEYDVKKVSYGLDQYLQSAIDENNLEIASVDISTTGTETITFYKYEPNIVSYALLENGDLNSNYATSVSELLETGDLLSTRQAVSVMANQVNMTMTGKREDLMNFLDTMKEDTNAINIESLNISDYSFKGGIEEREVTDAEGNVTTIAADPNAEGTSQLTIAIKYYNAKELDQPDLGD